MIGGKKNESLALGLVLAVSAGLMDAYSFFFRGKVFANAQTGNILLFSVGLAHRDWQTAWYYLCPIVAFSVGILLAALLGHRCGDIRCRLVLWAEVAVLFTVAFFSQEKNLVANCLISLACGAQLESFRVIRGNQVATTMCIGNLRSAVHAGVERLCGGNSCEGEKCHLYLYIIGAFAVGAILGSFLIDTFDAYAIWGCCGLLLVCQLLL